MVAVRLSRTGLLNFEASKCLRVDANLTKEKILNYFSFSFLNKKGSFENQYTLVETAGNLGNL